MLAAIVDAIRLARAGYVFAREGVFTALAPPDPPPAGRAFLSVLKLVERRGPTRGRLSTALVRLGPSYVKLGQFLATRRDIVGAETAADLERLQDRLPPFSMREARAVIARSFERPVESLFESFGEPIAAASIAQVHRARIGGDGPIRDAAVKILRPDVERRFARDLRSYFRVARLMESVSPTSRRMRPVALVDTLARSVTLEMDLRLEAAAISEMAENVKDDKDFRVPAIDWSRTSKRVLTIEWIDGIPLTDSAALAASGIDLRDLATRLIQAFLRHAMRDGFFHADMHQGNLFVDREGRLVAVDFGITGRLTRKERRFLAEIIYGFIRRDYRRVAEVHFEAEYVPPRHSVDSFAQALRSIGEPLQGKKAKDIAMSRVLSHLFDVTELFDMRARPELILLQKTMVVAEGVARGLDPDLDMWAAAEPVVKTWIERNLGVHGRVEAAAEGVAALGRVAADLPRLMETAERAAARFVSEEAADLVAKEKRAATIDRIALWIIALALAAMAVQSFFRG